MKMHTEQWGIPAHSINSPTKRWDEWSYLSRPIITCLTPVNHVSVFVVAATYRKEIRMKYRRCGSGLRRCLFQHVVHVTLPATASINAALRNLPSSGNHNSKPLKGSRSPWLSPRPITASLFTTSAHGMTHIIMSVFTDWLQDLIYLKKKKREALKVRLNVSTLCWISSPVYINILVYPETFPKKPTNSGKYGRTSPHASYILTVTGDFWPLTLCTWVHLKCGCVSECYKAFDPWWSGSHVSLDGMFKSFLFCCKVAPIIFYT